MILGHATSAFTADVYTEVAQELADAAAATIAAFVPARAWTVPEMCQQGPKVIIDANQGACAVAQTPWSERRLGDLNPGWA